MNIKILFIALAIAIIGCDGENESTILRENHWESKYIQNPLSDSLIHGSTYLSVFSNIYSKTEGRTHDLTATVSMRNINKKDTIYIDKADYFETEGHLIHSYVKRTIFIAPMETLEIIIDESNQKGGTGANFLFDWRKSEGSNDPLFQSVMISTSGQQGVSFTTQGVRLQ